MGNGDALPSAPAASNPPAPADGQGGSPPAAAFPEGLSAGRSSPCTSFPKGSVIRREKRRRMVSFPFTGSRTPSRSSPRSPTAQAHQRPSPGRRHRASNQVYSASCSVMSSPTETPPCISGNLSIALPPLQTAPPGTTYAQAGPFMRRSGDGVAAPDQQLGGAGRGADAPALNGHHVQVVLDQRTAVVQRCGCGLVNETGAGGRNAHSRSHS